MVLWCCDAVLFSRGARQVWQRTRCVMGCVASLARSAETNELHKAMKELMDANWGKRNDMMRAVHRACAYADDPSRLDLSVRYKGWNALHIAAYHGGGDCIYHLCGKENESINLDLAGSVNRPQGASVLMCIAYGKTCGLSQDERTFDQAGFKMIYRMSDEQLRYTDPKGCTALHYAAVHGVVNMVAALIERDVDLEARGVMNDEGELQVGLNVTATQWFEEGKGWQYAPVDTTPRTPLECARMRRQYQSKFKPDHARSQMDLKEVIELLEKATAQPELLMATPVITQMLTVAMVPAGQPLSVATPKGAQVVVVPSGVAVGMFFQFALSEPIPVADFRAWPRQINVTYTTTTATMQTPVDTDGDGVADLAVVTTTTSTAVQAEGRDVDGDGVADGILAVAAHQQ